ncbi:hypothetical protein T11_693, partial [Trichinella zimbabwensis]
LAPNSTSGLSLSAYGEDPPFFAVFFTNVIIT